jgi:hypothetical protein
MKEEFHISAKKEQMPVYSKSPVIAKQYVVSVLHEKDDPSSVCCKAIDNLVYWL